MGLQRKIPFGYRMENGVIMAHAQEADTVALIYDRYLQGGSFQTIADTMSGLGIRYHVTSAEWNKHMVKRILENPKYIGKDEYPAILPTDIWNSAQNMRDRKTAGYNTQPICVELVKRRFYCGECSLAVSKETFIKHGIRRWRCSNPECNVTLNIRDSILEELVSSLLNKLITLPALLIIEESDISPISIEASRLQNEINRELNKAEINSEHLTALIFSCAAEKYAVLDDGAGQRKIAGLKADLNKKSLLATFDPALFDDAVEAVLVMADKTIALRIVGGKIIS